MADQSSTEPQSATSGAPDAVGTNAPTAKTPATAEASRTSGRANRRKVREGVVSSAKMDKTVVVDIIERVRHRRYAKTVQRTKHLYAHDEANEVRAGDRVRVQETRPYSKQKRWRVVEILERAR
jgi:small subunit ribosomal protein S17